MQILLNVPDNKAPILLDVLQNISYVAVEKPADTDNGNGEKTLNETNAEINEARRNIAIKTMREMQQISVLNGNDKMLLTASILS